MDTGAESAFEAPKRLVTLVAIAVAAAALLVLPPPRTARWSWASLTLAQRLALGLAAGALAIAVISAILSPRRATSLDSARTLLLFALLLPLGASRALGGRRSLVLMGAFVGGSALNAALSLLQFFGMLRPLRFEAIGGRLEAVGLVGNEGVLGLSLVVSCLLCLAAVVWARRRALRAGAAALAVLSLAAVAVTQSLTALTALAAGAAVLAALSLGRRALSGAAVIGLLLVTGVALSSTRVLGPEPDWDSVLTYRLGAWAAAVEMGRARPLVGWGPGTFAAEFVPHRLAAELRHRRRFVNPHLAGSYGEAHSEYFQALAEGGVAGALFGVGALGALVAGLVRAIRHAPDDRSRRERVVLLAVLGAGAISALTWFPLQRAVTAVPLLLAAGRAWRMAGDPAAEARS